MSAWQSLLMSLFVLLLFGCRGGNVDLMERELRLQEDRIFELKDYIHEYQDMLGAAQQENAAMKHAERHRSRDDAKPADRGPWRDDDVKAIPPPEYPQIDRGDPIEEGQEPAPLEPPGEARRPTTGDAPTHGQIAKLVLNKRLTGGLDFDGHVGDEGIMVVVEPRTDQDQIVRALGDVSVMVVDARQPGVTGLVARWDLHPGEVAKAWQKRLLGKGLHFELAWPGAPPTVRRLRLYVRHITPEGEKLLADMEIDVDPPGHMTADAGRPPSAAKAGRGDGFTRRGADRPPDQWNRRRTPLPKRTPPPKRTFRVRRQPSSTASAPQEDRDRASAPPRTESPEAREVEPKRAAWKPFR